MEDKKTNMLAILQNIEGIENELRKIREQLVQNMNHVSYQAERQSFYDIAYTLDDLYMAFGKKKSYATRLSHALQMRGISSLPEFLSMTPGELMELDNVSVGTLKQTKKALDRLGIRW